MPKGPKGFSDKEKDNLRMKLCSECEQSWAQHGYKKTGIAELTSKVGLSTGAFYLLYTSKEELFCDTLQRIQNRLIKGMKDIAESEKGKSGFINVIKFNFMEYDKSPALYDVKSTDFLAFMNKLPKEHIEKLKYDGTSVFIYIIKELNLKLKIDEEKAHAIISSLLYTVILKDKILYNHYEVFEFLLNSVTEQLFE
jgi:AcrR family transcriptional regulator